MQKGEIIFLNGVSSAGKTTLAKTLQAQLDKPFYWLSVDAFDSMIPEKYNNRENISVVLKAVSAMHHTIKNFSDMGLNVIVDHVFERQDWMDECVELLHEYHVLFVHVTCPLDELRRREKERGDRKIGQGEAQLSLLNPIETYDVTVDTLNSSKEECADEIIKLLNYPEKFAAFKTLWLQRTK